MPWQTPQIPRDGHRDRVQTRAEEPRRLFAGASVLHVGTIVGLAEAPLEPGARDEPEIAIEKRDHRHQGARRLVISGEAHRLESRVKVFSKAGRIDPVGDDREMLQRRVDRHAAWNGPGEERRREAEILD